MPTPFTGEYASGTASLHWGVSSAADFLKFKLYRGVQADFVPGPGIWWVEKSDTGFVYTAGGPYFYKLSAVDKHMNESGFNSIVVALDVVDGASLALTLEGVLPNPSRGHELPVAFTLPKQGEAMLELLDVSGRRVVGREVGTLGIGHHVVNLGEGNHLAPGVYLVRLTQGATVRAMRVAIFD